jgi:hypothetical protein
MRSAAEGVVDMARSHGATTVTVTIGDAPWWDLSLGEIVIVLAPPAILYLLWRQARRRERGLA